MHVRKGAGAWIRGQREDRKLSQAELGRLCQCSQTTIYMVETESPRLPTLSYELASKICDYLGLKLERVFEATLPSDLPNVSIGSAGSRQQRRGSAVA